MLGKIWAYRRIWTFVLISSSVLYASDSDLTYVPEDVGPPQATVISHKKFTTKNRVEIGVFPYDGSLRNDYVNHNYAAHLTVGYHLFDWMSVHGYGGYTFLKGESDLMKQVRSEVGRNTSSGIALKDFGFSNSFFTTWSAGANLEWAPFYGKLSLSSEFETNFQLYLFGGGGAEGFEKLTPEGARGGIGTRWAANGGAGLRIFFADFLAFRVQLQQTFGLSPISQAISGRTWAHVGLGFFI